MLPDGVIESLFEDPFGQLSDILLGHIVSSSITSSNFSDGMIIETIFGNEITLSINDNGVMIDDVMITIADIIAGNGVIHVIDTIIFDCVNGVCILPGYVNSTLGVDFNPLVDCVDNSNCEPFVPGCTDADACNYIADANLSTPCVYPVDLVAIVYALNYYLFLLSFFPALVDNLRSYSLSIRTKYF